MGSLLQERWTRCSSGQDTPSGLVYNRQNACGLRFVSVCVGVCQACVQSIGVAQRCTRKEGMLRSIGPGLGGTHLPPAPP